MLLNILLVVIAFFFMEFVAWSNHKFVMHGFLWRWHKDHHVNDFKESLSLRGGSRFEKNDLFFLVYALPAIALLIIGFYNQIASLIAIGVGITLYGFTYFLLHDSLIHQRPRIPFLEKPKSRYFKAMVKAHKAHHWPKTKDDFHNYGLLIFPSRYFKD